MSVQRIIVLNAEKVITENLLQLRIFANAKLDFIMTIQCRCAKIVSMIVLLVPMIKYAAPAMLPNFEYSMQKILDVFVRKVITIIMLNYAYNVLITVRAV